MLKLTKYKKIIANWFYCIFFVFAYWIKNRIRITRKLSKYTYVINPINVIRVLCNKSNFFSFFKFSSMLPAISQIMFTIKTSLTEGETKICLNTMLNQQEGG